MIAVGSTLIESMAASTFGLRLPRVASPCAGHQLAGHRGFRHPLIADKCVSGHAHGMNAPGLDIDLYAELITGHDGTTKAGLLDSREDHELSVAIFHFGQQQSSARLGNRFHDENTR